VTIDGKSIGVFNVGGRFFALRNRCPHRGIELDWVPGAFLAVDGHHLQCATHGALFDPLSGV
jgi:nitrite reductase/ring-hydroxylating ferredoxin subunit